MPMNLMLGTGIGAPGRARFLPNQISGLAFWVDPSDADTVTVTSAPDVDSILDKSSNALLLTQATASAKPHNNVTINGLTALDFDVSASQFLRVIDQPFVGNVGMSFAVVRFPGSVPSGANSNAVAVGNSGGQPSVCFHRFDAVAGSLYASVGGGNIVANRVRGGTAMVADTTYIITTESTGSAYSVRVNGATETLTVLAGANNGNWVNDNAGMNNICLGQLDISTSTAFYEGLLGEVIYYDDVSLSAAQIEQVERYLANKWGATLA